LFLIGIKHCGKTTVGRLIAGKWGVPFFDLDDLVEKACTEQTGSLLSCRDIYREYGKPGFLRYEEEAAKRLVDLTYGPGGSSGGVSGAAGTVANFAAGGASGAPPGTVAVAALGGGTIENRRAMTVLEGFGLFVLLDAAPEVLFERIKRKGIPPFLAANPGTPGTGRAGGVPDGGRDIYAKFLELYRRRMELYRERADILIDTRGKAPREIAEEAAGEISRYRRIHEKERRV
jgi:shikimate kinase